MTTDLSLRNRANRNRGVRFERAIARKLRALGYVVRRNLEFDGFSTGVDLVVGAFNGSNPDTSQVRWLSLALQCKAGKDPRAIFRGLEEARKACPGAVAKVSIQSLHRNGFRPKLQILADYKLPDMEGRKECFITWAAFKTLLDELKHLTN